MPLPQLLGDFSGLEDWRSSAGGGCAFVPTMGALHKGHGRLIQEAAASGRPVLVSIFVNPLQFGPNEDYGRYPRTLEADLRLAGEAGASAVWAPEAADLTPPGMVCTVDPGPMGEVLCGAFRPGHFRGVATIVLKLFLLVRPASAYFGWKDAQQFIILRKMVQDLSLGVEMVGVETVREADGLAISSRNRYLPEELRREAAGIGRALMEERQRALDQGGVLKRSESVDRVRRGLAALPNIGEIQYVEMVSCRDLTVLEVSRPGDTLLAVALKYPQARLIDNVRW